MAGSPGSPGELRIGDVTGQDVPEGVLGLALDRRSPGRTGQLPSRELAERLVDLGEIALSAFIRVPLIFAFGIHFSEIVIYESLLFAVVQFHHANIRLPVAVETILSKIVVTPNIHRVHHSKWQPETDSNFSSLLAFWDRVCGTKRVCADLQKIELGLDEFGPGDENLAGIMEAPLRDLSRRRG